MFTFTRTTALVISGLLAAGTTAPAIAATNPDPATLEVAEPTGRHPVSTQTLHLVDRSRTDPWVPASGHRELMVTMTYPARSAQGRPATYTTPRESKALLDLEAEQGQPLPPEVPRDILSRVDVGATTEARIDRRRGGSPLVVLSPGFSLPRSSLTGLATELASRGFVVASVDHTYEAAGVELPDGRLARCEACDVEDYARIPRGRAKDVSFVLDRLLRPASRWSRLIDEDRIGMAGHSIGGNASATTMARDKRIDAGVNLDGSFFEPLHKKMHRPFLMMGTREMHKPRGGDRTWPAAYKRLTGERVWLTVAHSEHFSFVDYPALIDQLGLGQPASPLPGARALQVTRAYVGAFFDRHLRDKPSPLLDAPSKRYAEVTFHQTS